MIEFINLKREYQSIKKEINLAIQNVLEKQWFLLGDELKKFENEFANYLGDGFGIRVNSGSNSLYIGVKTLNIGKGDEEFIK